MSYSGYRGTPMYNFRLRVRSVWAVCAVLGLMLLLLLSVPGWVSERWEEGRREALL